MDLTGSTGRWTTSRGGVGEDVGDWVDKTENDEEVDDLEEGRRSECQSSLESTYQASV